MASPTTVPGFSGGDLRQVTDEAARLLASLRRHGAGPGGSVTRLVYGEAWRAAMAALSAAANSSSAAAVLMNNSCRAPLARAMAFQFFTVTVYQHRERL